MYTVDDLVRGFNNPKRLLTELNRYYHSRLYTKNSVDGISVFDEDWDFLIILDACRYDIFEDVAELPRDTLTSVTSSGAHSTEWVSANFGGETLHDLVYVTSNPWLSRLSAEIDASIHHHEYVADGVTNPDVLTAKAIEAASEFPNKRICVHYVQPHFPYLEYDFPEDGDLMTSVKRSGASQKTVNEAYRSNLEIVLPEVETLFEELSGKFVVSADHGEMLGERQRPIPIRWFGHPRRIWIEELIEVPWLEYVSGERRDIIAERPKTEPTIDEHETTESLKALGYLE